MREVGGSSPSSGSTANAMAEDLAVYSWSEAVRTVDPAMLSAPDQAAVATVVMYARNFGIGRPISAQRAAYTAQDLIHVGILLKWWSVLLDTCNLSNSQKTNHRAVVRALSRSITGAVPLPMIAVFCPSYKLGRGNIGFEHNVGEHTCAVIDQMVTFLRRSVRAGLRVQLDAHFSDLLLENYDLLQGTDYRHDLEQNYQSFCCRFSEAGLTDLSVRRLSSLGELVERIGEAGTHSSAQRDPKLFRHVYLRNRVFYAEQLGWSDDRIRLRTEILYDSYAEMGLVFRGHNANTVLYWTESAQERAGLYSSALEPAAPLPVIYPQKL